MIIQWIVLTVALAAPIFTAQTLFGWIVETQGVWADGQIISIHHCTSRGVELSTVALEISFIDQSGARHVAEASCKDDVYAVGQTITIRYLPGFPWRVLTRDDIGGGLGTPLVILIAVDAVVLSLCAFWIVAMVKSSRQATQARAALRQRFQTRQRANPAITRAIRTQRRRARR